MSAEVSAWVRFYHRREAEGFGPLDLPLWCKRARVLAYIRSHCPEACALIGAA